MCGGMTFLASAQKTAVDTSTAGTVIQTFGSVYDQFLKEPFSNWLTSFDAEYGYDNRNENISYKAPGFGQEQFAISVFDFYKNPDFSKKIKIGYPDGTVAYKTVKHGEQLVIKQAGVLIDLDPDSEKAVEGDVHYITQNILYSGNLGVSLINWQTFYLKKASETFINLPMILRFYLNVNPGNFSFDKYVLYNELDPIKKAMATVTTDTISKEDFINSFNLTTEEIQDFSERVFTFQFDN
ncbi:hypothetical protein ICU_04992 [Bacillus cereus BAG2X1-1]|nr:hypothetical protein ICU_04992 [Bacillus cereus BAG2X1-1]